MKLLFPDSVILRIPIACVCFFLPALSERMYRLFRLRMRIVCIPKLDNNAYLAALIKTENWSLKPSSAKIYLNQNYCGEI